MGKVTSLTGGEGEPPAGGLHPREMPGEAASPRETVGQDLRSARLKRGDELGQVSHALRIRKDYLEALESDHPQNLPGRTYAIGFIRTYANYLGLDAPSLVSRYKLATVGFPESAPQVGPAPEPGGFRLGGGWMLSGLAAAALLMYGIYALSRSAVPAVPKPARVAAGAEFHTAVSRPGLTHTAPRPAPVSQPSNAGGPAIPAGQVLGAQNRGARVVLHVLALTHILVDGPGGKVYINRLLHPGDVYRVPNMVGLSLTTPNGGAVSLELDGRDVGAAGRAGSILEGLSLNPAAIVDRKRAGDPGKPDKVTP